MRFVLQIRFAVKSFSKLLVCTKTLVFVKQGRILQNYCSNLSQNYCSNLSQNYWSNLYQNYCSNLWNYCSNLSQNYCSNLSQSSSVFIVNFCANKYTFLFVVCLITTSEKIKYSTNVCILARYLFLRQYDRDCIREILHSHLGKTILFILKKNSLKSGYTKKQVWAHVEKQAVLEKNNFLILLLINSVFNMIFLNK